MTAHPYRQLWENRDLEAWGDALSNDVVIFSPMLKRPFTGKASALELFEILLGALKDVEVTDEFLEGPSNAFFWRANVGSETIEGADLIRHDSSGMIVEIRVLIRPLVDIATFGEVVGPLLAGRRGVVRGTIAALVGKPLRLILRLVDAIATRLVSPNASRGIDG